MSSATLKVIAAVMVGLAVVFGLLLVNFYRQNEQRARAAEEKAQQQPALTLAVVAAKPLAAYKPIDRESVALVPLPVVPAQYFTTLEDVVGRVPLIDVDAGAPVTARYFKEGNVLARIIPPGFQALSLEINDVIAVGGFVRPGDIVDLLVYLRGGQGIGEPQARVLLKQVRVLAYEDRIVDRPEGLKDEEKTGGGASGRRVRTAVLAVAEADTTRVMLGASLGELRLALRGQDPLGEEKQAAPVTEGGVPLSPEAIAAGEAQKIPDQVLTASQLAKLQRPPAPKGQPSAATPPPAPTVEIYRGSQRERVTTKN